MITNLWGDKTGFMKKEDSINKTEHQNVKTVARSKNGNAKMRNRLRLTHQ